MIAVFLADGFEEIEALAVVDGNIVAARQENQLAVAFHPELDDDLSIHRYFVEMVEQAAQYRQARHLKNTRHQTPQAETLHTEWKFVFGAYLIKPL